MKPILVLVCVFLALLAAGTLVFFGVSKAPAPQVAASSPSELSDLRAELKALEQRIDAMQQATHLESGGGSRVSQSDVDAAVERALASRAPAESAPAAGKGAATPPKLDART